MYPLVGVGLGQARGPTLRVRGSPTDCKVLLYSPQCNKAFRPSPPVENFISAAVIQVDALPKGWRKGESRSKTCLEPKDDFSRSVAQTILI